MRSILSSAELRLLRGEPTKFTTDYRRHLSVRISKKLLLAMKLLTDPKLAPYLDRLETSIEFYRLTRYLSEHRVFRQSFILSLMGAPDISPVIGVSQEDSDKELFYG